MGDSTMITNVLRAALYLGAILVGISLQMEARPVNLDEVSGIASSALGKMSGWDVIGDVVAGRWGELRATAKGLASSAGTAAKAQIEAQVRANIITGAVFGALGALAVDLLILS